MDSTTAPPVRSRAYREMKRQETDLAFQSITESERENRKRKTEALREARIRQQEKKLPESP